MLFWDNLESGFQERDWLGRVKYPDTFFHIPEHFLNLSIIEIIHLSLSQDMQKMLSRKNIDYTLIKIVRMIVVEEYCSEQNKCLSHRQFLHS